MTIIKSVTSKFAIDFETGKPVPLPFPLPTKFEVDPSINFTPQFFVIKTLLPYGLDEQEGKVIICGDLWGASVSIFAWTFNGEPWQKVRLHPEEFGSVINIDYYESLPDGEFKYNWTPPGIITTFDGNKNWEKVARQAEPFRDFVRRVKHLQ